MVFWIRRIVIWFVIVCVIWFAFTRPAKLGNTVNAIAHGVGQAVDAVTIFFDTVAP